MITFLILSGLILLTLVAGILLAPKVTAIGLIPLSFLFYYIASTELPKSFGYPVTMNFAELNEALLINAFVSGDKILLLVAEKGKKEPRLLSIEGTPENLKALDEINKKKKTGPVVIKKNNGEGTGGEGSGDHYEGDLLILEFKDQTIFNKDVE